MQTHTHTHTNTHTYFDNLPCQILKLSNKHTHTFMREKINCLSGWQLLKSTSQQTRTTSEVQKLLRHLLKMDLWDNP